MTIKIKGQLVDRSTGLPIAEANIDGLIKVVNDAALFAKTQTAPDGRFQFEFAERQWEQLIAADPEAFVYFRVFIAGRTEPIAETRDTARWRPERSAQDLRIEIDDPSLRRVRGTIWTSAGEPAAHAMVRAYIRQSDGSRKLLTAAETGDAGAYVIAYSSQKLGTEFADIYLSVFADAGGKELLGSSDLLSTAAAEAVLDFVLPPAQSRYENYIAKLEPLLNGRALQDLNDADVKTLSAKSEIPSEQVTLLVSSARLAEETDINRIIFFALLSDHTGPSLNEILALPEDRIAAVLDKAQESRVVPRLDANLRASAMQQLKALQTNRAPLASIAGTIGIDRTALEKLERLNVKTLGDVLSTGGLRFLAGLDLSPDDASAQKLDAHARLMTLSADVAVNEKLIAKGYASIGAIASASVEEIAKAVGAPAERVTALLAKAKAETAVIQNAATAFAANTATGQIQPIEDWRADHPIHQVLPESCGCKDCEAAVSPRAYLADLMQYAIDHLRYNGAKIDLGFFKDNFHQPFSELPASCAAQDEQVRQVRICIEVLRAVLGRRPLTPAPREAALKRAEQEYLLNVYQLLLTKLGTSFTEVRLIRGAPLDAQKQFADRIGVPIAAVGSLFLDPNAALTESALEKLFGLADSTQPALHQRPAASIQTWRLQQLRESWKAQDWPSDEYWERKLPIIDPDILGPDDFRNPFTKPNANDSDRAFDIWMNRRSWADRLIQTLKSVAPRQDINTTGPSFEGIVNAMSVAYQGQAPAWPSSALDDIRDKLSLITNGNTETTVNDLFSNYGLSLDAARRLVELWEKDNLFWTRKDPARAPRLAVEEWEDLYSILLRAQKNALRQFWLQEEKESVLARVQSGELSKTWAQDDDAGQILLAQREFWKPLRKPVESAWPPYRVAATPLIDPDKIKRDVLPDPTAGKRAFKFWDDRFNALAAQQKSLQAKLKTSNFSDMVTDALGAVPQGVTSWVDYFRNLTRDLADPDPAKVAAATARITDDLHLTLENFQRIVGVMESYLATGSRPLPTKADMQQLFSLLTSAWKEKTLYPTWYVEEIDATNGVEPWRCVRHSLQSWRATAQDRERWERALDRRSGSALIDPDLLATTAYFTTPGTGAAWSVWDQRRRAIENKVASLIGQGAGANRTLATLHSITDTELGTAVLEELAEAKNAGSLNLARLQQVNLSFDTLNELLRIRELLTATQPQEVLDSEWSNVASILTQVWKQRQFGDWQIEERTKGLSLNPDHFKPLTIDLTQFPPAPLPTPGQWRGSRDSLLDWQDKLQSRIDEERDTINALAAAVSEAEEQTLPALRDALVVAAAPAGVTTKSFGDHLGIALEYGGCHQTTRITQAIETFQIILWGVRTGMLDTFPNLKLVAPDFDEEWKWIGSYATWRAAMFVFLYPENILLPSLRRVQTPGFVDLIEELRGVRKLTPLRARQAAERYAAYFRDVCSLTLKARHEATIKDQRSERQVGFVFAQSATRSLYWSVLDSAGLPDYPQTFWEKIAAFKSVQSVIGTAIYRRFGNEQILYLFAVTSKEGHDEISFVKYDLNQYGRYDWPEDSINLGSPPNASTFDAVSLIARDSETTPLGLRIRLPNGVIYERRLNVEGDDWDSGEWNAMDRYWSPWVRSGQGQFAPETVLTIFGHKDPSVATVIGVRNDGRVCAARWNDYLSNPTTKLQPFQPIQPTQQPAFTRGTGISVMSRGADETANDKMLLITDPGGVPWEISWSDVSGWTSWQRTGGNAGSGGQPQQFLTGTNVSPKVARLNPKRSMQFLIRDPETFLGNSTGWDPDNSWVSWWDGVTKTWSVGWVVTHNERRRSDGNKKEPLFPRNTPTACVTRRRGVVDLFAVTDDKLICMTTRDENDTAPEWTLWKIIPNSSGVPAGGSITAAVPNSTGVELFFVNEDGVCRTARFNSRETENDGWSNWTEVGGGVRLKVDCPITAVTVADDHIVLFAVGRDGKLYSSWRSSSFEGGKWQPWVSVGEQLFPDAKKIAVLARSTGLVVFAVSQDGQVVWSESKGSWNPLAEPWLGSFVWKPQGASLASLTIAEQLSDSERQARPQSINQTYSENWAAYRSTTTYLEEAFFFVPLHIALQLQKSGAFVAALDWFRLVYDYTLPRFQRQLTGLPTPPANAVNTYQRNIQNWLRDPLNPHSIAETRSKTYVRYACLTIISCLLDYADDEFTQDTSESVPRARELYETAQEMLDTPELQQAKGACDQVIGDVSIAVDDPHWEWVIGQIKAQLKNFSNPSVLREAVRQLTPILDAQNSIDKKYVAAQAVLAGVNDQHKSLGKVVDDSSANLPSIESAVLSNPAIANALESRSTNRRVDGFAENLADRPAPGIWKSNVVFNFCVPPNPVLRALRMRSDLNLYKIRNCRNIAGMRRQLEAFAAATDTTSGMPTIGGAGQLVVPGTTRIQPTNYRYTVLIERAKQLAQHAMQVESAFLTALEKSDKEAFDILTARGNLRLAQASVRLQDIRLTEAQDGVRLAELQRDRANIQSRTFEEWIDTGALAHERMLLTLYDYLAVTQIASVAFGSIMQGITGGVAIGPIYAAQVAYQLANAGRGIAESFGIDIQRNINRLNVQISQELRAREWSLQKAIADQDIRIGEEQIQLANDHTRVVEQERNIEQLKTDHAREVLDFLSTKFTNKDLYDWMSGILERVYSFFLQQATSIAQLASDQLAFERQEPAPSYIQADYWEGPSEDSNSSSGPDRRGLTGSARLLQDIYQLDQYAFEKNRRKQQLTKTLSLPQLDPLAFQRFRETGVLPFTTSMELFDRDFPGHYLRLIKRVRTTLIALVPPSQGIRATLTASGISRVVTGGDVFQTTILRRAPEAVALSAAFNSTGLFEMQEQADLLLPFEDHGVAMSWEFALPKGANSFDYSTIADVLVTIDYTALQSFDYKAQVVQLLNSKRTVSADRAFTFRSQFADAWYDLNNPENTTTPMSVSFEIFREDFPPNVDNIRIEHVSFYVSRRAGANVEFESVELSLQQPGSGSLGGVCRTDSGLITTRAAGGNGWLALRNGAPFGTWRLTLPNTAQTTQWFKDGDIADIMLVITYAGRLPEWTV
jgi:hypothetical protein